MSISSTLTILNTSSQLSSCDEVYTVKFTLCRGSIVRIGVHRTEVTSKASATSAGLFDPFT